MKGKLLVGRHPETEDTDTDRFLHLRQFRPDDRPLLHQPNTRPPLLEEEQTDGEKEDQAKRLNRCDQGWGKAPRKGLASMMGWMFRRHGMSFTMKHPPNQPADGKTHAPLPPFPSQPAGMS
jgi:hypothetical protein